MPTADPVPPLSLDAEGLLSPFPLVAAEVVVRLHLLLLAPFVEAVLLLAPFVEAVLLLV